jgi:type VI secretion system secreted protein Hcp
MDPRGSHFGRRREQGRLEPGLLRAFVVACVAWLALCAHGAVEAYLFLPGVSGDANEPNHRGWIQVGGFEHGVFKSSPLASPGFLGLSVTKQVDASSPALFGATAGRARFDSARLHLLDRGVSSIVFYELALSNVTVAAVSTFGATGSSSPLERVRLEFEFISWTYTVVDASGAQRERVDAYWNLLTQQGDSAQNPRLRLTGFRKAGSAVTATWNAREGRRYELQSSVAASGPYGLAAQATAMNTGPLTVTLPASSPLLQFYRVQETP